MLYDPKRWGGEEPWDHRPQRTAAARLPDDMSLLAVSLVLALAGAVCFAIALGYLTKLGVEYEMSRINTAVTAQIHLPLKLK